MIPIDEESQGDKKQKEGDFQNRPFDGVFVTVDIIIALVI